MTATKELPATLEDVSKFEALMLHGDLSKLSPKEKISYYKLTCEKIGIDWMSHPFDYLTLNGKEVLYLRASGAYEIAKKHNVSFEIKHVERLGDAYVVTARATQAGFIHEKATGGIQSLPSRHNEATGAVDVKGLYGERLCNAMLKAETKAKRRAIISLLGLPMMDETEVETIPNATIKQAELTEDVEVVETPAKEELAPPLLATCVTATDRIAFYDWAKANGVNFQGLVAMLKASQPDFVFSEIETTLTYRMVEDIKERILAGAK
jgi:hypothetical protein